MPTQEINTAFVTDIMERLYSQRPHMERLGGGVNMHVYAASFGDGAEDKVIKLAGEGQWKPWAVLDEEAVMRALRKQGISEVPEADKISSGACPLRPNNCRAADRRKGQEGGAMQQKQPIEPKPKHWGDSYAEIFKDESVASAYQFRAPYPPQVFEILLNLIPASAAPKVVLDAGCGPGQMARGLVRQVDSVDAIDYSAALIAKGQTLPEGDNPKLHWHCSPIETAKLQPTYSLIVAAVSLHWMEWRVVLPRFADHLAPDGYLAMVEAPSLPRPWDAEVGKVFAKYSMNQDFQAMALAPELARRGLFQLTGSQTTDPILFRQSVADWIEAVHASNGFSRDRMAPEAARECDAALTQILTAYCADGMVEQQIIGRVTWGKPLSGS